MLRVSLYNEKLSSLARAEKYEQGRVCSTGPFYHTTIGGGGQWKGNSIKEEVLIGRLFCRAIIKKNDQTLGGLE